jgi:hypothetical protein
MKSMHESSAMKIKEVNALLNQHLQSLSNVMIHMEEEEAAALSQPPSQHMDEISAASSADKAMTAAAADSGSYGVDMSMTQLSSAHHPSTPSRKTTRFEEEDDKIDGVSDENAKSSAMEEATPIQGDSQSSSSGDDQPEQKRVRLSPPDEHVSDREVVNPMEIVARYSETQLPLKSQDAVDQLMIDEEETKVDALAPALEEHPGVEHQPAAAEVESELIEYAEPKSADHDEDESGSHGQGHNACESSSAEPALSYPASSAGKYRINAPRSIHIDYDRITGFLVCLHRGSLAIIDS